MIRLKMLILVKFYSILMKLKVNNPKWSLKDLEISFRFSELQLFIPNRLKRLMELLRISLKHH